MRTMGIIQSGVINDVATGAPIAIWIMNKDVRSGELFRITQA